MTYAVPLKVTFRLFVYDKDPETGDTHDARRQGGGGLLRRDPADDRQRHLRHQRHRARHRLASSTAPRASSSPRRGRAPTSPRSSPTAAPGWSSSTTRRTCCRSASTASASSTAPSSCAPSASRPTSRSCASSTPPVGAASRGQGQVHAHHPAQGDRAGARSRTARPAAAARPTRSSPASCSTKEMVGQLEKGEALDVAGRSSRDLERACFIADVVDLDTGEVLLRGQRAGARGHRRAARGPQTTAARGLLPGLGPRRRVISNTLAKDTTTNAKEALIEIYRRMRPGDPPTLESARSLFYGMFFDAKRYDFSRVGRFKFNIKLDTDVPVDQKTLSADDFFRVIELPAAPAQGRRPRRRHRQPRQPPRARGGRAAREPVPHRPGAHGARHQGEDVGPSGHRLGDAARPDQLEAGDRGDQGVLRLVAALAVHGPDQPAVRGHPQAAPLGARTGRPVARARRVRGARRARLALRPHLPDRDPGRPEHRPHLVARDLRPDQRLRVHREPLQEGRGRPRARPLPRGARWATARSSSARSSPATSSRRSTPSCRRPASARSRPSRTPST